MHWLYPLFYMEEKFRHLEKIIKKKIDINWNEIFQKNSQKRNGEILEEFKIEQVEGKLGWF